MNPEGTGKKFTNWSAFEDELLDGGMFVGATNDLAEQVQRDQRPQGLEGEEYRFCVDGLCNERHDQKKMLAEEELGHCFKLVCNAIANSQPDGQAICTLNLFWRGEKKARERSQSLKCDENKLGRSKDR